MKKTKFTEAQIVFSLKQDESGVPVAEVCRRMGVSEATFYNWKKKYGGSGVAELRRLHQVEEENRLLKQFSSGYESGQTNVTVWIISLFNYLIG